MRRCDDNDYCMLMEYLRKEPVYHTFMIADIERYGFDKDYQTIYVQDANDGYSGIFLKFYNNLIVSGVEAELDFDKVEALVTDEITTIMGEAELVRRISASLGKKHEYEQKELYVLREPVYTGEGEALDGRIRLAELADVDRIYDFLMAIPQLKPLYSRKDMLWNRLNNREGIHVILEDQGRIIAHGNSAASTDNTVMLGGIGVMPAYRRKGYALGIMKRLCIEIQNEGRVPCIFAGKGALGALCRKLGFERYGFWGTIQIKEDTE